jgi:hypothetical protein
VVQHGDGKASAVVAKLVTLAESALGPKKGVMKVGDEAVSQARA